MIPGSPEYAGINLTRPPRQSSLLYAEPLLWFHWSSRAGNGCQPMQTPSGCSRAASSSILHRGSGRKGSVSSNVQPPGKGLYLIGDIDWGDSGGGNLPGVVSALK